MRSFSGASKARGVARKKEAIRFTHSNWAGSMGSSSSPVRGSKGKKATPQVRIRARPRLVGSTKARDLIRLS